jgi:type II secretory pathway predicted ATPase ExeA
MPDVGAVPNPYDFANPVSDIGLFIGRKEELAEITYYLEHAKKSKRPINIAFLGGRASGKTSLLNVTEQEAKKVGLLTARIDLDEGDAANEWTFFFKIFDALFSAACEMGAYGGQQGKTFDAYVDATCSLVVPSDKTFCPFFFPIQYAKAAATNNLQAHVPDYGFRQDLATVHAEVNRPIVLLFDESNVLSRSRVHLQKLRNIFMNTRGYMLILTGTREMFPLMDEVFSPIIRQFKKINLAQFTDRDETEILIRKYLEAGGLISEELFDFDDSNDLQDIHDLTGGRPYEIQLVCHTLFRRVQQKRASKMQLDLGAIEEVRQQLESSQNLARRPVLHRIQSLNLSSLKALMVFASCAGSATFEQMWAVEHVLGAGAWKRDELSAKLAHGIPN